MTVPTITDVRVYRRVPVDGIHYRSGVYMMRMHIHHRQPSCLGTSFSCQYQEEKGSVCASYVCLKYHFYISSVLDFRARRCRYLHIANTMRQEVQSVTVYHHEEGAPCWALDGNGARFILHQRRMWATESCAILIRQHVGTVHEIYGPESTRARPRKEYPLALVGSSDPCLYLPGTAA